MKKESIVACMKRLRQNSTYKDQNLVAAEAEKSDDQWQGNRKLKWCDPYGHGETWLSQGQAN